MSNKSGRNLPYQEKNVTNDQILYGSSLVLAKPLAVQYGGTGLQVTGTAGQVLYVVSDGVLGYETLPPYPTPTDFNIYSGNWSGQVYGWDGSLANPTGGPWNFTGSYARAGDVVSISFVVQGTYSSAALGSKPYMSGMPTFGKTVVDYNGTLNAYYSGFTGAPLPYTCAAGTGASGNDMTFFTGATQLTFELSGGSLYFWGCVTYNIM